MQRVTARGRGKRKRAEGRAAPQSYNSGMALKELLSLIDAEIATLKEARALLATGSAVTAAPRKAGRPPKVVASSPKASPRKKKKRVISPEGRARISEAVKRRWAAQKKAAK